MSASLEDQVTLITGGSRGIGLACAEALNDRGVYVIAVARGREELDAFVDRRPEQRDGWALDVTGDELPRRIEAMDRLDILVNNAGTNRPQPVESIELEVFDLMLDLNVRAAFRVAQAAVRVMLRNDSGGSIINMSSQMGHVGAPNRTSYCTTKHAIEGMTKAMAVELAPKKIRVNAVAPTFIDTPLVRPMLDDPEFAQYVQDRIPMGEVGKPEHVAAAVTYLASPESGLVTGHSLLVDGGWTAQ